MKRIPAVVFAFFIIILTTACSVKTAPAAVAQAPAVTITPLTIATLPPTLMQTPTAKPSVTLETSYTLAPTITQTATPALPTPTPTIGYAQQCITIEDQLPADLDAEGALLLQGGRFASRWNRTMFHFDLMSQRRSPLPYAYRDLKASPDGNWLAFLDLRYDAKGSERERLLKVVNAEGRHLDLSAWGLNWQYLLGWTDAEHLLIMAPGYPGGDYILLNPFTMQKDVLRMDVPAAWWDDTPDYQNRVFPNRQLSHWVVEDTSGSVHAWRLLRSDGWDDVWKGEHEYFITPNWSPDGQYFAIMGDFTNLGDTYVQWMLLRVGTDGTAVPLTNRTSEMTALSWSPDSRFLAGWMQLELQQYDWYPNRLALVNALSPQVIDLCFENQVPEDTGYVENQPPIWSPDGRYLAIGVSRIKERGTFSRYASDVLMWDTAIIDLQARRGYLLAKDARPQAWMRKP